MKEGEVQSSPGYCHECGYRTRKVAGQRPRAQGFVLRPPVLNHDQIRAANEDEDLLRMMENMTIREPRGNN